MPTVLRVHGYRFFFFSNEGREPAHIHVQSGRIALSFGCIPLPWPRLSVTMQGNSVSYGSLS